MDLDHFVESEFGIWFKKMNPKVLLAIDKFRDIRGKPVHISPHPHALGRHLGLKNTSQHNIDFWKKVNAIDFFPEGIESKGDRAQAFEDAKEAGFSGIGIYTDTTYKKNCNIMMHGDVRADRTTQDPAKWSRVKGKYLSIERVF